MLVVLGFLMIAVFMTLILSKRMSPVVALVLVPLVFALLAGAGTDLGDMVLDGFKSLAPTAGLLFFAIIFFGIMIEVGLFDPLVRAILRIVGRDPVKIVVGTAVLASVISLDGDGSTTFIIVVSAFLPIYRKVGLSAVVLTVVAATANGVMNTTPWAGATILASTALDVSPVDVFVPMIPAILAGVVAVVGLAYALGLSERRRLAWAGDPADQRESVLVAADGERSPVAGDLDAPPPETSMTSEASEPSSAPTDTDRVTRPHARPRLIWFNAALTVALVALLVADVVPPVVTLMIATATALLVNFPKVAEQADQLKAHASSVVSVVALVFAASVLTGVMSGTGMIDEMARWIVGVLPESLGPHLTVVAGLLGLPLTYFTSNPSYFLGMLPVLTETASHYGIAPAEMARAALIGQPLHTSSPIIASFLLLVSLAKVEIGDHARKALWFAPIVSVVMLLVGGLTGAYTL